MESPKSSTRLTRTRSKNVSTSETTASNSDIEMAPNLNGSKDGENDSENSTSKDLEESTSVKSSGEDKGSPVRLTRKRKHMDMKTDEEEMNDSLEETKDEPKAEGSSNDSELEGASADESQNPDVPEHDTPLDSSAADESAASSSANINDSISNDLKTINTGIETYGKGKRARVPNKRYSDISRAISRTPKHEGTRSVARTPSSSARNGEFPDDDLGEILREESELEAQRETQGSILKKVSSIKKSASKVDMSDPEYLRPFKFGWRRELVIRATTTDGKRNGDIYYYSPTGKKLRSMREVSDYIGRNKEGAISIANFTFFKEPLGVNDTSKEIIRDAKRAGGSVATHSKKFVSKMMIKAKKKIKSPVSPPPAPIKSTKPVRTASFKVKPPIKGVTPKREKKDTANLEMATVPANWNFSKKSKSNKKISAPTPAVKTPSKAPLGRPKESTQQVSRPGPPNFMNMYLQNLQYGYTTLFCVFQYLKVQDLLRAGCVCSMWKDLSRHPALWQAVRMKNSQIHCFEGMANALKEHGTTHLDLRKMLLPTNGTNDDIWPSFTNAIKKVDTLRRIELCRCLASVVEDLARNNHKLEVINAVTIKCEIMNFEPFANLSNLVDLRIKSTAGLTLSSDLSALKSLTKLKHLSITSIKDLNKLNIEVISVLSNLEVLDLGECTDFPKKFGPEILSKLTKLEKLRLEKGQGECYTFDILEAVKDLENLQQLELVNFDIKSGFDKSLGLCSNIKKLLIIPTYISQSATTNHMVLGGVLRLQKTLSHFVWGVTLELLRVTELFVDQCEQPDRKESRDKSASSGDSIPVLKPVPLHGMQQATDGSVTTETPQVEILPLPNLQKLLLQNLPQTRVKILKIPFHATWRQNIIDSVN